MNKRPVVLIVVDMQVGLDDPQYGERCNPACEGNVLRLLRAWRQARQPVMYTQHLSLRPGSPLAAGSAGTAIKKEIGPLSNEPVFKKSVNSALKNLDLLASLQRVNPSDVIVVGMATDACVTATVREAKDMGYKTAVVREACATFARPKSAGTAYPAATVQGVALAALAASGIAVYTTAEALDLVAR